MHNGYLFKVLISFLGLYTAALEVFFPFFHQFGYTLPDFSDFAIGALKEKKIKGTEQ